MSLFAVSLDNDDELEVEASRFELNVTHDCFYFYDDVGVVACAPRGSVKYILKQEA